MNKLSLNFLAFILLVLPAAAQVRFTYTTNNDAITIKECDLFGSSTNVIIPASTNGYPVTSIGADAFYDLNNMTSVIIPSSVTNIGNQAFAYCSKLTSLSIPKSVIGLGGSAFGGSAFIGCSSLTNITVIVGNPAYSSLNGVLFNQNKTALIAFPEGLGGSYAIPNGVTSISVEAFDACSGVTNLTLPSSLTNIGELAFDACYGLTSLNFPNSLTNIDSDAFDACSGLTSLTLPNGLTSIEDGAFEGCFGLTNIILPNSITSIGYQAFEGCRGLTNLALIDGVTNIDFEAFQYCTGLTNVIIGNSVTIIGDQAFADCGRLTSLTIGDRVSIISDYAFYDCTSLTSLTIPNSVTSILTEGFQLCTSVTNITFLGNAPVLADTNEFTDDGVAADVVYYYAGTSGWGSTYGGLPTVELSAPPQAVKGSVGVLAGNFGFNISGTSNQVIVVEACTNLINPNWLPIKTNTLGGTPFNFTDPQWKNFHGRFYRVGYLN